MDPEILPELPEPEARPCPHAGECPGCPLLGLSYAEQRVHKMRLVRDAISSYSELAAVQVSACVSGQPVYGYRTRAKWVAAGRSLGLFRRGGHQVLDLPGCLVVEPAIARVTQQLRTLLPDQPLLDGADIARVGTQLLVTLIGAPDVPDSELQALAQRLGAQLPEGSGIAVTRRTRAAVQLLAGGHQHLHGAAELRASAGPSGPYHYMAFGAFLQVNEHVAQAIRASLVGACASLQRERAAGGAGEGLRVLELYAGSGALALTLAARGMRVTAVESFAPACERLQRAAREQELALDVEQGDAEAHVLAHAARGTRFDVVLLNPPRRGLPPALREAVAALRPARVGYVSCRPATLARDLAHFARLGLVAASILPFDMMPHTEQVESLVWLEPGAARIPEVLHQSPALVALNKAGHQRLSPPSQTTSTRPPPRGISGQRVREVLSAEGSGVLLQVPEGAPEPTPVRRVFTLLVRGVTHARGRIKGMPYERVRVLRGHSLVHVEGDAEAKLRTAFAAIGHPVLGDARADRASAKHFWLRHGLDRAFVHLGEVTLDAPSGVVLRVPLPADLSAVLASLEAGADRDAVE